MKKDRPSSQNELRLNLVKLSQAALEKTKGGIKKRKLRPSLRTFMRFKATGRGLIGEESEKPDWSSASFIILHEMEKFPLYKKIVDSIIELYGVDSEKSSDWLSRFVYWIVHMAS